jgi:hypothetical protein
MAEDKSPRYFTQEEANAALAVIRPLISQILEIRQRILSKQPEIWPVLERAAGNGGSKTASLVEREFEQLGSLTHKLEATGAILKDINTGLVDFLALRDGKDVFLCWKYGEERVEYWHSLDAGFAGRQLIG